MGNETPHVDVPLEAYYCKYSKPTFYKSLDLLRDTHRVTQNYASLLIDLSKNDQDENTIKELRSISTRNNGEEISKYNYSNNLIKYFSETPSRHNPDLCLNFDHLADVIDNTCLPLTYNEFLGKINDLEDKYNTLADVGRGDVVIQRRNLINRVFNACFIVQRYLIEDLWDNCNRMGNKKFDISVFGGEGYKINDFIPNTTGIYPEIPFIPEKEEEKHDTKDVPEGLPIEVDILSDNSPHQIGGNAYMPQQPFLFNNYASSDSTNSISTNSTNSTNSNSDTDSYYSDSY